MKSVTTKAFRNRLTRLPAEVVQQASRVYGIWKSDPWHSSLQFKRVGATQPIYSVRVGLGYRALGLWENETVTWFWIGTHADYDTLLERM